MTIYFIRAVDCGRIKIGYTDAETPAGRLNSMQTGCPSDLKVLAHCEGSEKREGELHALFKATRARGEWFKPSKRLASLIAYANRCKTTAGWEDAEENPELWAKHFVKYSDPAKRREFVGHDDATIRWELQLCLELERSLKHQSPRPWSAFRPSVDGFREWQHAPDSIVHLAADPRNASEFDWIRGNSRMYESKGARHTALLLAHAKDAETVQAIWVGACIQGLSNDRKGDSYGARKRVPDLLELESSIREKLGGDWWHAASTSALPLDFVLPERCIVTAEEFVFLVARHRLATLAIFLPLALWQQGAHSEVHIEQEEEAA